METAATNYRNTIIFSISSVVTRALPYVLHRPSVASRSSIETDKWIENELAKRLTWFMLHSVLNKFEYIFNKVNTFVGNLVSNSGLSQFF